MSDVAQRAVDAGGVVSIFVGIGSWMGANLPVLVQGASFVLSICAIVRYVYLGWRWARGDRKT